MTTDITLLAEEQPAYKIANMGFDSVTNSELLSLIIGGTPSKALTAAHKIMSMCDGSLAKLARMQKETLATCEGVGTAKVNAIMAAFELGRRRQSEQGNNEQRFNNSEALAQLLRPRMQDLIHEVADVVLLNNNFNLIKIVRISEGGITETAVDVRLILREALLNNATVVALAHNHPSGNRRPSRNDDNLTKRVKTACDAVRVKLIDHIIIACDGYYSYSDEGKINQ